MKFDHIQDILKSKKALPESLFCTVHRVEKDEIIIIYSSHPEPEPLGRYQKIGRGIVGQAILKKEIINVPDVYHDKYYLQIYKHTRSELAIPILSRREVLGVINFESSQVNYFEDVSEFVNLAEQLAEYFHLMEPAGNTEILLPEVGLIASDTKLVGVTINGISDSLLNHLSNDPQLLYRLPPRKFEELIARLLEDMGYRVSLTPETRDGGRDILAFSKLPTGQLLTLVECKRQSPIRPVSVEIVRNLYGVLMHDRATYAMIATTSYFTKDAQLFQDTIRYQMSLKDYQDISGWLKRYG